MIINVVKCDLCTEVIDKDNPSRVKVQFKPERGWDSYSYHYSGSGVFCQNCQTKIIKFISKLRKKGSPFTIPEIDEEL